MPEHDDQRAAAGRTVGKRYVLGREIGRGASGSVCVALDRQLERQVAVKVLRRTHLEHAEALLQFEREAQAIAQLRSPNIVQVYDFGFEDQHPFIVMELLEGEGLDSRLQRRGRLSLTAVARIVNDLACGLTCVHAQKMIHSDLKPANVFLAKEAGLEVTKLLDFGVSKRVGSDDESQLVAEGTPRYMSPEHIMGHRPDSAVDTWALAVLTYQMLTGVLPFDGDSMEAVRRSVCMGDFEPPSTRVPGLDPGIDALFWRAMAKEQSARFRTVDDFASEFARLAAEHGDHVTTILFVDDESDMEFLLRQRFRHQIREGTHELLFARNGEAALQELRRRPDIDVVLTDLNMPGMNGLTFLSHVPELNPLVRVVVVSAYGDMNNIRAAMNGGAFDFLCKPIDFEDMDRTIQRCTLNVVQLRRALASREENGILRLLLGSGAVDRFVNVGRTALHSPPESFEATVMSVGLSDPHELLAAHAAETCFEVVRAHFDVLVSEVLAQQGIVAQFSGDSLLTVFRGVAHVERALDAALALRDRLLDLSVRSGPRAWPYGARIGIDSGLVHSGSVGSRALGRVDQALVGEPVRRAILLQHSARGFEIVVAGELDRQLSATHVCRPRLPSPTDDNRPLSAFRVDSRADSRLETTTPGPETGRTTALDLSGKN